MHRVLTPGPPGNSHVCYVICCVASDEKNFPKCFINFINFQEETAVETGKASKGEKTKQSGEEDDLEFKPDKSFKTRRVPSNACVLRHHVI